MALIVFLPLAVAHVLIMDVGGSVVLEPEKEHPDWIAVYHELDGEKTTLWFDTYVEAMVHVGMDDSLVYYAPNHPELLQEEHNREVPKEDDTHLPDWEEDFETHIKVCREEHDPRHHRGRRNKHPKWMRTSALRSREVMC